MNFLRTIIRFILAWVGTPFVIFIILFAWIMGEDADVKHFANSWWEWATVRG